MILSFIRCYMTLDQHIPDYEQKPYLNGEVEKTSLSKVLALCALIATQVGCTIKDTNDQMKSTSQNENQAPITLVNPNPKLYSLNKSAPIASPTHENDAYKHEAIIKDPILSKSIVLKRAKEGIRLYPLQKISAQELISLLERYVNENNKGQSDKIIFEPVESTSKDSQQYRQVYLQKGNRSGNVKATPIINSRLRIFLEKTADSTMANKTVSFASGTILEKVPDKVEIKTRREAMEEAEKEAELQQGELQPSSGQLVIKIDNNTPQFMWRFEGTHTSPQMVGDVLYHAFTIEVPADRMPH